MSDTPFILAVDDDPDDQLLLADAWEEAKLDVELRFARSAEEALERLAGDCARASLILLDLHMPGTDGLELLRRLHSNAATQPLPAVVMSTAWQPAEVNAAYRAGASSFLVKPVIFEELVSQLRVLHRYWFRLCALPAERG